jgi:hypothetical protein
MRGAGILLVLLATGASQAQPQSQPKPQPDVAIFATVRARELRFDQVGPVSVTAIGAVNGRPALTVDRSDRQNLPERVQPYVTYRDIGIRLTITSTLPDIEKILDEALGPPPAPPSPERKPATRKKSKR